MACKAQNSCSNYQKPGLNKSLKNPQHICDITASLKAKAGQHRIRPCPPQRAAMHSTRSWKATSHVRRTESPQSLHDNPLSTPTPGQTEAHDKYKPTLLPGNQTRAATSSQGLAATALCWFSHGALFSPSIQTTCSQRMRNRTCTFTQERKYFGTSQKRLSMFKERKERLSKDHIISNKRKICLGNIIISLVKKCLPKTLRDLVTTTSHTLHQRNHSSFSFSQS